MASFGFLLYFVSIFLIFSCVFSYDEISLTPNEQESTYKVLEAINSAIQWRSLFPDDLCNSGPHGIVCEYFNDDSNNPNITNLHVTELSFGYVSDYSSNPPCNPTNASFSPQITNLTHLRKLFFYKCFGDSNTKVSLPGYLSSLSSTIEELVFIENPSLFGTLSGKLGNFKYLKKLVLTGTMVSGEIPEKISMFPLMEQITLSRNGFSGFVPETMGLLQKLKVLDLSNNGFQGILPSSLGNLTELIKLDVGFNLFNGRIPEELSSLKKLEFLDLSNNGFSPFGVPLFLSEMVRLKEVYLTGNKLGGQIPEIWEKLGGILGLGLSGLGLVGEIPSSMGVYLRNVSYLGLDNNELEGEVPEEFTLLESINELNLEKNKLSGRVPFSDNFTAKVGVKLKLGGNEGLCLMSGENILGNLRVCEKVSIPSPVLVSGCYSMQRGVYSHLLLMMGFWVLNFL
ncbi:hypothetical protein GIB67_030201 [Kingdonia uniflora]|uniref:non-specific serine/threonine protein kinase n=1 Tax=Kingdonia uniflora TaxID=39325 RepID=A0A7J7MNA4_9MAGN|nr:hypothetical protein GIB67_030201 [Kingdonia uniflora]